MYVFCNLVILVCDVGELVVRGYCFSGVGVMDMFLYIVYVELIVLFDCC